MKNKVEFQLNLYLIENAKLKCLEKIDKFHIFTDNSSPTHLYIRPKEVELDVDLLDKHDSFYHTTKSLLVLFQIMGIMPIKRSAPGKNIFQFFFTFHFFFS